MNERASAALSRKRIGALATGLAAAWAVAAVAVGDPTLVGDPGQTVYVRISNTARTVGFALGVTEATGNYVGTYPATPAAILSAAGGTLAANTTDGYLARFFVGATPSLTANDQLLGSCRFGWSGTAEAPLEADLAAGAVDAAAVGTAAIDADAIASGAIVAGTEATGFATLSAADVWAVGTRTLTSGAGIVLAKGVGVTGFNDLDAAAVNAQADLAITDAKLDLLALSPVTGEGAVAGSILADLIEDNAGTVRFTTAALGQAPTGGGGGATAGAIADAVWDELLSDHDANGSTGETFITMAGHANTAAAEAADAALNAAAAVTAVEGLNDVAAADVWEVGTRTLSSGANIVLAKGTGVTGFNDLSSAQVNAEADLAIADAKLDLVAGAAVTGEGAGAGSILADLIEDNAGTVRFTTAALGLAPTGGGGGTAEPISPIWVRPSRTWQPNPLDSSAAQNVVTVTRLFEGTLCAVMPLNVNDEGENVGIIDDVVSVSITGAATVTPTDLAKRSDGQAANFTVPSLTVAGTYTVVVTVRTIDDQLLALTGTLRVR